MELGEDQRQVIEAVTGASETTFFTLSGYAGTGKTLVASKIIDDEAFSEVLILAPTAAALNALKRKFEGVISDKVTFRTVASLTSHPISQLSFPKFNQKFDAIPKMIPEINDFIHRRFSVEPGFSVMDPVYVMDEDDDRISFDVQALTEDLGTPVEDGVRFVNVKSENITQVIVNNRWDLVVIDEYSMVPDTTDELFSDVVSTLARTAEDRVVFLACGDPGQLPPVEAPINSRIIAPVDGVKHFELTTVRRSDDVIAHLAARLRDGASLAQMAMQSNVPMVQPCAVNPYTLYSQYGAYMVSGDSTVVLTWMNKDKDVFNRLIRAGRGLEGPVSVGDRLVVKKNVYAGPGLISWANGEVYRVIEKASTDWLSELVDLIHAQWDQENVEDEQELQQEDLSEADAEDLRLRITSRQRDQQRLLDGFREVSGWMNSGLISLVRVDDDYEKRWAFLRSDVTRPFDRRWREVQKRLRSFGQLVKIAHIEADFAYAMTVHTAQGSEFDQVVYVAAGWHLQRQAVSSWDRQGWHAPYTAITRAKKGLLVLFQP